MDKSGWRLTLSAAYPEPSACSHEIVGIVAAVGSEVRLRRHNSCFRARQSPARRLHGRAELRLVALLTPYKLSG
jgi:hypothetical protein